MVSTGKMNFYGGMTWTDLWYWLINHGASRHEIGKNLTEFLFDPYKWKHSQRMKQRLYWIINEVNLSLRANFQT